MEGSNVMIFLKNILIGVLKRQGANIRFRRVERSKDNDKISSTMWPSKIPWNGMNIQENDVFDFFKFMYWARKIMSLISKLPDKNFCMNE